MNRMIKVLMCAAAMAIVTAALSAQAAQAPPVEKAPTAVSDLTGKWTMKVSGGPHGDAAMGLVIKQEGEKLTGTFNPGHDGDIPMTGTFAKGALTLVSPANDDGSRITMKGTLKTDGTLSGYLSSAMGDMTWSAARDKSK